MATIMSPEGNEARPERAARSTSKKPGKLVGDRFGAAKLDALARGDAGDRAEHRQAMVSPRVDDPAAKSRRDAPDPEPVPGRADVPADPPQLLDHRLDPVGLLRAQLPAPRTTVSPRA